MKSTLLLATVVAVALLATGAYAVPLGKSRVVVKPVDPLRFVILKPVPTVQDAWNVSY